MFLCSRIKLSRIFLEVNFKNLSQLKKSDDFSLPYSVKDEEVKEIPFRNIDEIGPAGSINSCVDDMLKWIRFHLNQGKVGEIQLISKSEIRSMHTPYMHISSTMRSNEKSHRNYGLGWYTWMYRGHMLVEHGGSIDGFFTSVSYSSRILNFLDF